MAARRASEDNGAPAAQRAKLEPDRAILTLLPLEDPTSAGNHVHFSIASSVTNMLSGLLPEVTQFLSQVDQPHLSQLRLTKVTPTLLVRMMNQHAILLQRTYRPSSETKPLSDFQNLRDCIRVLLPMVQGCVGRGVPDQDNLHWCLVLAERALWLQDEKKMSEPFLEIAQGTSLANPSNRPAVIQALVKCFKEGWLPFPWKRLDSRFKAAQLIANLKQHNCPPIPGDLKPHNVKMIAQGLLPLKFEKTVEDPGHFEAMGFLHDDSDYERMDVLVDLFQEQERLKAKRKDQETSTLEEWNNESFIRESVEECFKRYGNEPILFSAQLLRDIIYEKHKECTQFKPSLVKNVIDFFQARRMLDFSAGWGDRLAGALAANVERYQGYDPNTDLRPGHRAIFRAFDGPEIDGRFDISYQGFETAKVEGTFDLVFTSPPFFDFEIYTKLPGQSVSKFPSLNKWIVHFLFVCIHKAWAALEENGHVVIHITDVYKDKVCEKMCLLVLWLLPGAHYRGVLNSVGGARRPRPLWVFQKRHDLKSRAVSAGKMLASSQWLGDDESKNPPVFKLACEAFGIDSKGWEQQMPLQYSVPTNA